jgi:hypothetical protein
MAATTDPVMALDLKEEHLQIMTHTIHHP